MNLKSKKVVFVVETRFQVRDSKRYGVEFFKSKGFEVEIWDLSWIVNPVYAKEYVAPDRYTENVFEFKKISDFAESANKLTSEDLILQTRCRGKKFHRILQILTHSQAPYGHFDFGNQPGDNRILKKSGIEKYLSRIKNTVLNPKKLSTNLYNRIPKKYLGIQPLDFLILGGGKDIALRNHEVDASKTKWLWTHTLDYDLYLENERSQQSRAESDYILYLDSYLCFHPTMKIRGTKPFIDTDRFFKRLRAHFEKLEEVYQLPVIIAAHPRSEYDKMDGEFFGDREKVKGNTIQLVKNASLVLSHFSNSSVFAALYEKPMVFMTTDQIEGEGSPYVGYAQAYASGVGAPCINLDHDVATIDYEATRSPDLQNYKEFVERYVKRSDSPQEPFWEIFYKFYTEELLNQKN